MSGFVSKIPKNKLEPIYIGNTNVDINTKVDSITKIN